MRVNKHSAVTLLGYLASLVLLLAIFSGFNDFFFSAYFSSDTLYLPSVYKDLFTDHHYIKDWNLNPAPNFFPDMLVYFAILILSAKNFIVASFIFSILQYFVILILFKQIFKRVMPLHYKNYFIVVLILFSFFLLESLFLGKDFIYTFYIISNSYHTGSFVMALCSLCLLLTYFQKPRNLILLMLFILSVLCVASDKIFIVLFSAPALVTSIFYLRRQNLKKYSLLISVIIVSVICGVELFNYLKESGFAGFDNPHKMFAMEDAKQCFNLFFEQLKAYMSELTFKALTLYLFFIGFIALCILFFKTRNQLHEQNLNIFIFYTICFDVIVLFAPIINGSYTGYDTLRYNIFPVYLSALSNVIIIAYVITKYNLKKYVLAGNYLLLLSTILLCIIGALYISKSGLTSYFNYYPKTVQQVDSIVKKHNLKCGIANYWMAKKTTLFSKNNVKLYAVFEDFSTYEHVANRKWFSDNVFDYIILNDLKDTVICHYYFDRVEIIHQQPDLNIIKVRDFKYDRKYGYKPITVDSLRLKTNF